jgi:hypothetical protein
MPDVTVCSPHKLNRTFPPTTMLITADSFISVAKALMDAVSATEVTLGDTYTTITGLLLLLHHVTSAMEMFGKEEEAEADNKDTA